MANSLPAVQSARYFRIKRWPSRGSKRNFPSFAPLQTSVSLRMFVGSTSSPRRIARRSMRRNTRFHQRFDSFSLSAAMPRTGVCRCERLTAPRFYHEIGAARATNPRRVACSSALPRRKARGHRLFHWSGRRESNPRLLLGRQGHYHYATPALDARFTKKRRASLWRTRAVRLVGRAGFEPAYRFREPGLQPGAINHSTTDPGWGPAVIRERRVAFLPLRTASLRARP